MKFPSHGSNDLQQRKTNAGQEREKKMEVGSIYRELVDLNARLENELNRHAKQIKALGSGDVDAFDESPRALSSATTRDAVDDRHVFLSAAITLLEDRPRTGAMDRTRGQAPLEDRTRGRLIKRGRLMKKPRGTATVMKRGQWKKKDVSLRFGQFLHDDVHEDGTGPQQKKDGKWVELERARSVKIENDVLKVVTDLGMHEFSALPGDTEDERRRQLEDWKLAFEFAVAHVPPKQSDLLAEALFEPNVGDGQIRFEKLRQKLNSACSKHEYLGALRNIATVAVEAKWVHIQMNEQSEQQQRQRSAGAGAGGVSAKSKGNAIQKIWSLVPGPATRSSSPAIQPSRSSSTAPCAGQVFLDMKRDKVKVAGELIVNDPDRAFGTLTRKILELHPRPPEAATGVASDDSGVADAGPEDSRYMNPLRARVVSPTGSGSALSPTPGDGAGWPKLTEERALAFAHLVLVKAATRTQSAGDAYFAAHLLCVSDGLTQACDSLGDVPILSPLQGGDDAAEPIEIHIERREHPVGSASPLLSNGSEGSASQDDGELGMIKGLEIEVRVSSDFELKGPDGEGGLPRRWAKVRADFNQKFFLADEAEEPVAGEGTVSVSVHDLVEGDEA